MTRLVCRSAPLPTRMIAWQMESDAWAHAKAADPFTLPPMRAWLVVRFTVAKPKDTDNGQCWSEDIFSTLSA